MDISLSDIHPGDIVRFKNKWPPFDIYHNMEGRMDRYLGKKLMVRSKNMISFTCYTDVLWYWKPEYVEEVIHTKSVPSDVPILAGDYVRQNRDLFLVTENTTAPPVREGVDERLSVTSCDSGFSCVIIAPRNSLTVVRTVRVLSVVQPQPPEEPDFTPASEQEWFSFIYGM